MKRRMLALTLSVLMLFALMAGCAKDESADSEKKTFTVGFDAEFPPYGYTDEDGNYIGFDLDLAAEVCKRLDWELVLQPIIWDAKDAELESGTIDCIWNGFTINSREDDYTWSVPYCDNSQVIVVSADSGITGWDDLSGKVMAVQADSSAQAALTAEDAADDVKGLTDSLNELLEVPDYNTAFMNLEVGAVDAVAMDIGVAKYQLESRGDGYVMLDKPISEEQYGIGFYLGNTELMYTVQGVIYEMVYDGTFQQIAENWGMQDTVCLDW